MKSHKLKAIARRMEKVKSILPALCLSIPLLVLTGCKTREPITRTLKVPAEVNMAGRDRVILEPIQGQGGQLVTARLKPALVAAQFKVLDRQSLGTRVQEEEINRLVSDEQERQKIKSAGVLIRGNVLRHAFEHNVEQAEQTVVRNGVQYRVPAYRDVGRGTVEVAFDVVELGTTETIASKSIPVTQNGDTGWFTSPPNLNQEPIFNDCYSMVVDRFMKAISAHSEEFKDALYILSKLPENQSGISMFKAQDHGRAIKHFEAALESAKALPKTTPDQLSQIWHNIGLSYECDHKYEKAIDCYKQSLTLHSGSASQKSLTRCQQRIENEKRLKEQGVRVRAS